MKLLAVNSWRSENHVVGRESKQQSEEEVLAQFEHWADNPQVRDWICQA